MAEEKRLRRRREAAEAFAARIMSREEAVAAEARQVEEARRKGQEILKEQRLRRAENLVGR